MKELVNWKKENLYFTFMLYFFFIPGHVHGLLCIRYLTADAAGGAT